MSRARSVSQLVGANTALGNTTVSGVLATGNTTITGQLVANQNNSGGVAAISLPQDESTIKGPYANTEIRMGGNLVLRAAGQASIDTAGVGRIIIDSSGRTTMAYQPSFYTYLNSGTFSTNGGVVPFDTVSHNVGSCYNNTTYRFTAPVSGYYLFCITAISNSTNYVEMGVYLNGTGTMPFNIRGSATTNSTQAGAGGSFIYYLSANDYLQCKLLGASSMYGGGPYTTWSGRLLG